MEKSNNGKLFLGFVIGVLVAAVVGLTGYIIYDKNNNKVNDNGQLENSDNNNVNNGNNNAVEDNKVTELSLEDDFVKRVFNLHSVFLYHNKNEISQFYGSDKMLVSSLSKDVIYNMFIDWMFDVSESRKDEYFKYYDKDTVLSEWRMLFGSDLTFNLYDYEDFESDGTYKKCINCGSDVGIIGVKNTLLRATKSDNEIILYETVKFMEFGKNDDDPPLWYKDYNKTIPTTENENIDANYKFIYKKDVNGNYYFYGVEKIK